MSSNDLNQTFPVAVDQTCTPVRSDFGLLLLAKLFKFNQVVWMSAVNGSQEVCPQHFYWAEVWALTGPLQKVARGTEAAPNHTAPFTVLL